MENIHQVPVLRPDVTNDLIHFLPWHLKATFTIQNSFTSKELDLDDPRSSDTKVKIKKSTQTTEQFCSV